MTVAITLRLLLGVQLDHGINAHNGYTSFNSTLELLNLAHAGFQNTGLEAVVDSSLHQIETIALVCLLLGDSLLVLVGIAFLEALGESVAYSELCDEFRRVLGGVDSQGLGDYEERLGEFTDSELFPGTLWREENWLG